MVIGRWTSSPFGAFADAMVESAAGHRTLIAPNDDVAALIGELYDFDAVATAAIVTERSPRRLRFAGGPLHAELTVGGRDALGWCLAAVPRRVATSPGWAIAIDPVARLVMRGVRTRGRTAGGREFYAATDRHRLTAVRATWEGADLGELRAVDPPVRFGFSSTPKRPSIVGVATTVIPDGAA